MHPSLLAITQNLGRQNNFNFLRLVLASLVIVSHSPEILDGNRSRELLWMTFGTISLGDLAVNGFFVLSGYLIMQSWATTPDLWNFLRSRVLRIYPAFIVASLLSVFVVGYLGGEPGYLSRIWLRGVAQNIAFLQMPETPATFQGTHHPSVNGSMWTIATEFTCYMAVLVFGVTGLAKRRLVALLVLAMLVTAFIAERWALLESLLDYPVGRETFRLGTCFAMGATFYMNRQSIPWSRALAGISTACLVVGLFSHHFAHIAVAVFGSYILFFIAFSPLPVLSVFRRWPDISYGLYLYGWPTQKLIVQAVPSISPTELTFVTLPIAGVCGWLSWTMIEKRALAFKVAVSRANAETPTLAP